VLLAGELGAETGSLKTASTTAHSRQVAVTDQFTPRDTTVSGGGHVATFDDRAGDIRTEFPPRSPPRVRLACPGRQMIWVIAALQAL
jgi:hypothetical protein